jgi:SAM-dependent methyltransferase
MSTAVPRPDGSDERIAREQQFHDERFAEGVDERGAGRFYALVGPSEACYHDKLAQIPAGSSALELGCGLEMSAWQLLPRGIDVTAIDISQVAIDQAAAHAKEIGADGSKFLHMNAEALEFPDDSFDVVYGDAILHHLDLHRSLSEISRVLRPGGRAIFSEPTGHNPVINLYRRFTPDQRTEDEHPFVMSDFDIVRRYFGELETRFFHFTSLAALALLKTKAFQPTADRLERVDQQLFHRFPSLQRFGWMVVFDASQPTGATTP